MVEEQGSLSNSVVSRRLVLGVGAHRTGTSSLTRALTVLGYRASHWDDRAEIRRDRSQGMLAFGLMSRVDAVSDLPIPTIWRDLASTFPDAYFVLTARAPLRWIDSAERHMQGRDLVPEEQEFYGRSTFDRQSFLSTFVQHNEAVREYFAGCENFLVMDIEVGDGWEKLCRFLRIDVPVGVPFPWESALSGGQDPVG